MRRLVIAFSLLALVAALVWWRTLMASRRMAIERVAPSSGEDRVASARERHGAAIRRRCTDAGVTYPPRELFLRAFKAQRELEVWGGGGTLRMIATWPVLAASGKPGPKRREGDRQVPEGCYRVAMFNPLSNFHLSLGLDYPNASDRVRSDPQTPGSDIYIHGGAASIGCLALGDDVIEELFLLARDTRDEVRVHLFPARMSGAAWEKQRAAHPEHADFWAELEPIYAAFEQTKRVPAVSVEPDGRYRLR